MPVKEIYREHGISYATFCKCNAKYGDLVASDIKRLKCLEEKNTKLKRIVANLSLENNGVKNVLKKSTVAGRLTQSGKSIGAREDFCLTTLQDCSPRSFIGFILEEAQGGRLFDRGIALAGGKASCHWLLGIVITG